MAKLIYLEVGEKCLKITSVYRWSRIYCCKSFIIRWMGQSGKNWVAYTLYLFSDVLKHCIWLNLWFALGPKTRWQVTLNSGWNSMLTNYILPLELLLNLHITCNIIHRCGDAVCFEGRGGRQARLVASPVILKAHVAHISHPPRKASWGLVSTDRNRS